MVDLRGNPELVGQVDPKDYIMIHKDTLRMLISDNARFKKGAEICSIMGPLFLGISLNNIGVGFFSNNSNSWTAIFGAILLYLSFKLKHERENTLNKILKEKLDESQQNHGK